MSIIIDQNSAGNIDAPSEGSSAIFVDQAGQLSVKQANGVSGSIPTVNSSNTQVIFNSLGNLVGSSSLTYATGLLSSPGFAGDGSSLSNINASNITGAVPYATTANSVAGANVSGIVSLAATASYALSAGSASTAGSATTAGTVTTAAQPNITSVGTLTSLSVNGNLNMNSQYITNLSQPVNDSDAASKSYVDTTAQGLSVKQSVIAATTGTLATASGGTVSYNNGTGGVGATLTTTGTYTLIDSVNIASSGTRILVKNEANTVWNGIYTYTSGTVLTRSTDFDNSPGQEIAGAFVFVADGTTNDNTGWVCTNTNPVVVGASQITFTQFSGAGTYTAGTGLTLTGSQFSVNANQSLTSVSASGNITANFFIGNGSQLTGLSTFSISNGTSNVIVTSSSNVNISVAGNSNIFRVTGTGANVTGTLSVSGNANIANIGTSILTATGNVVGANLVTGGVLSVTGNANVGNIGTSSLTVSGVSNLASVTTTSTINSLGNVIGSNLVTSGVLSVTGNANVGNIGATTAIVTTGNITTINSGLVQNGNSNVTITANGNVTINAVGGARIVATSTGANITGTLSASGNANVGNIGTGIITATGNVTASFFIGNGSQLTGLAGGSSISNGTSNVNISASGGNVTTSVGGTGNVMIVTSTGANVAGTLSVSGNITGANLATGGLITATGNVTAANFITSGASGNITGANVIFANSITTTGSVAFGNLIVLANGNASATGTGIAFPATQNPSSDANTLDDYEEGTWTPTFTSTGASFTYPRGQYGSYCKIGSLVYAQFYVGANASGTTSNAVTLDGLPFASANLNALAQSSGSAWISTATNVGLTKNNNDSSVTLWAQNNSTTTVTAAQMSGGYFVGMIVYRAA